MGAKHFARRIKMFTSVLCIVLAVCATLASHSSAKYIERHKRDVASDLDIPSIDASPIGPEFWDRIFNQGNSEQQRRIAVNPVVQNVTRDEVGKLSATEITQPPKKGDFATTDKKKKKKDSDRKERKEKKKDKKTTEIPTTMQPTPHPLPAEVKKPSQAQEPQDKKRTEIPTTMQPTPHPLPAEVKKPSQAQEPRFGSPSQMHPNASASVMPHAETGYLFHALGLLTNDAHSFVQMLEDLNEKNYKTLANLLRHHHSSSLGAADYDTMLQTWMQIAIGSEELTESFLRRMHNLAGANRSVDYTSALLSNLRIYLKSYVSGILKRQHTVLQTAFGFVNQNSSGLTLARKECVM
ncbi:unnamed protein product [Dicrocoelium dendriticum]|nr:unnamed protein product [Dicrocoelium dendriticum]